MEATRYGTQVESRGIYHGLPVYPRDLQGLNAIVAGANGISGHHAVNVLAQNPQRWAKIYCLSRRPPAVPEDIGNNLTDPRRDYVFFYAHAHIPVDGGSPDDYVRNDEELCRVNGRLLKNFLDALVLANNRPKGILLQTGGKSYSGHYGPYKVPMEEWDARLNVGPNFYHIQEDILWKYCEGNSVHWTVTMPMAVLGAVPDSSMNICFILAIYASVCQYLNETLAFPGDRFCWQCITDESSATLSAYLAEWAMLSGKANNQRLNSVDGMHFTYESFWPQMASWYGIPWSGPTEDGITEVEYGISPPPRGYGPKGKIGFKFTFTSWAERPEVQQAWREIAKRDDLRHKALPNPSVFAFGDWVVFRREPATAASMIKARKMGWHGVVDSYECHLECFETLAKLKMIPKVPRVNVKFLLLFNKYGHGINHIKGPFWAAFTDLWRMLDVWNGHAETTHIRLHQKYGKLVRLGPRCVSVSDPKAIKIIYGFNSGFIKSDFYTLFRAVAKGRILQSMVNITDESFHAKLRRSVSNAFAMSTLVQFEPLVDSTISVFLDQLSRLHSDRDGDAAVCDLGVWLQFFAFDVIGELTFSKRLGFVDRGMDVDHIMREIDKVGKYVAPIGQMPFLDKLFKKNPVRLFCSKWGLIRENAPVVDFARKQMATHSANGGTQKSSGIGLKRDFLSRFREAQSSSPDFITEERVLGLTVGDVLGGSDTTAISLRAIFYYLLKNPEKMAKLMHELEDEVQAGHFRQDDGLPKWEEVRNLPYLTAVVKEAFRIFPATALMLERIVPQQGVSICGEFLPGGTTVGCNAWALHQDRSIFGEDPEMFRPERWIEASEEELTGMNNTMFVFGAGPRACLGKNISYLEIYKVVPAILLRFELALARPNEDWEFHNAWLAKQKNLQVVLKARSKKSSQVLGNE
ncbi:Cytochrome P450 monooxygenase [Pseudocercospora fuligena]|uniref:Cytochrome P450 monooxygenase n=1 Tax=Pseudocercospora fuligena TaxID=685502 RepID=A0A8H6RLH4_9PEZI|nr:Cytochrome P450 monooxygenase [Pseudocercospora fuligena]